jgi:cephalosporin hydroxylase
LTPREIAHLAYEKHHASQREEELAEVLEVVAATDPRVIVEIGCDAGGTLFCWRQLCDAVFGITLPDNTWPTGGQSLPLVDHGAEVYTGDSHEPETLCWLRERLDGQPVDMLHIDGDHSYAGVKADFEMYSPLVGPGGLVLIHDVLNDADPRVEVPRFWRELDRGFVIARPMRPIGFGVIQMKGTAA